MSARGLRIDLRLAGEAATLGIGFGGRTLLELARIAEYIERSVYVPGSFVRRPGGFRFHLANPPLRLGAFGAAEIHRDGVSLPSDRLWVQPGPSEPWRALSTLSRSAPLVLAPGRPVAFEARGGPELVEGRSYSVRLTLHSVAIPPPVWIEFRERIGRAEPP